MRTPPTAPTDITRQVQCTTKKHRSAGSVLENQARRRRVRTRSHSLRIAAYEHDNGLKQNGRSGHAAAEQGFGF
jgi:hypothetical protein